MFASAGLQVSLSTTTRILWYKCLLRGNAHSSTTSRLCRAFLSHCCLESYQRKICTGRNASTEWHAGKGVHASGILLSTYWYLRVVEALLRHTGPLFVTIESIEKTWSQVPGFCRLLRRLSVAATLPFHHVGISSPRVLLLTAI